MAKQNSTRMLHWLGGAMKAFIAIAATAFSFSAQADTWTDPATEIKWTYTISGTTVKITDVGPKYPEGDVVIPTTLGSKYVTAIGNSTFDGLASITSVKIPITVTSIGESALEDCSALMNINIPSGVTTIGKRAFKGCSALTSVAIPDSVTTLGDDVFCGCASLAQVELPPAFTVAGFRDKYFSGCPTSLAVASRETVDGLEWHYQVKDGTAEICYDEVKDNPAIPSSKTGTITIPATLGGCPVTSIGNKAFWGCTKLTSVANLDSVTSIGDAAFWGCDGLADSDGFVIVRGVLHYYSGYDYDVTIPAGVTRIGSMAFMGCYFIDSVNIPDSVTSIGDAAFWGCSGLADSDGFVIVRNVLHYYAEHDADVTIPGDVTRIGESAFENNSHVKNVTIPASVTSIGDGAFSWCSKLESIRMPKDVVSIGKDAFKGTPTLTVHVEAGETGRAKGLFESSGRAPDTITCVEDLPPACTITFNANGGSLSPATRRVTIGTAIGALPVPTRPGFIFGGWSTAAEGGMQVVAPVIATADVTYFAQWAEISAGTWLTKKDDAMAEAKRTGKKVFLIRGRDTCGNTMYTKNTSCESPAVKPTLIAKCVLWYCNIDGELGSESDVYKSGLGGYTLPLVCIIDPNDPDNFIKRSTGPLYAADVLALIADLPYASTSTSADSGSSKEKEIDAGDIKEPYRANKAVTLQGAAYDGSAAVAGVIELKIGRPSGGMAKVSGTVTLLNGKKHTIKSKRVSFGDNMAATIQLDVKGLGSMDVAVGDNRFAGTLSGWHVQSAKVGGSWGKSSVAVSVAVPDALLFKGRLLSDLLPYKDEGKVSGSKWSFGKAAGVKWTKVKPGVEPLEQDEASGKGLVVDTTKGKTNLSGLKLTYTAKKGTFKGSFKAYELQGSGAKTKLKKYTVNVNGVVVDGVGYGAAVCKRPAFSCQVLAK